MVIIYSARERVSSGTVYHSGDWSIVDQPGARAELINHLNETANESHCGVSLSRTSSDIAYPTHNLTVEPGRAFAMGFVSCRSALRAWPLEQSSSRRAGQRARTL